MTDETAGPGHNSDVERKAFIEALSLRIIDDQKLETARKSRTANGKKIKASGIEVGDLDQIIKMMGWTPKEIAEYFGRKLRYLGYANVKHGTQFDLFNEKAPVSGQADYRWAGLMAGLEGKIPKPPANLFQDQAQTWMEGWHEGDSTRSATLAEQAAAAIAADEKRKAAQAADLAGTTDVQGTEGEAGDDYGAGEDAPHQEPEAPVENSQAAATPKPEFQEDDPKELERQSGRAAAREKREAAKASAAAKEGGQAVVKH